MPRDLFRYREAEIRECSSVTVKMFMEWGQDWGVRTAQAGRPARREAEASAGEVLVVVV